MSHQKVLRPSNAARSPRGSPFSLGLISRLPTLPTCPTWHACFSSRSKVASRRKGCWPKYTVGRNKLCAVPAMRSFGNRYRPVPELALLVPAYNIHNTSERHFPQRFLAITDEREMVDCRREGRAGFKAHCRRGTSPFPAHKAATVGGGASRWVLGSATLTVTVIHPFPHSDDCRGSSAATGGGFMAFIVSPFVQGELTSR